MKVKLLAVVVTSGFMIGAVGYAAAPAPAIVDNGGNLKMSAPAAAGQNPPAAVTAPPTGAAPPSDVNRQPTPYSVSQPNAPYGQSQEMSASQGPDQMQSGGMPAATPHSDEMPTGQPAPSATVATGQPPSGAGAVPSSGPGPGETSLGVLPRPKLDSTQQPIPSKDNMPAMPSPQG